MNVRSRQQPPSAQKGVAILVITIILLLVTTIATMMVGRVGMFEQKLVGTDVRAKEVNSAAVGGLEYAVRVFEETYETLPWSDADGNGVSCAGDTASPDALANTALNADAYAHQITYTLKNCLDQSPIVVTATSLASAVDDSHVQKTAEIEVMVGTIIDSPLGATVQGNDPSIFQGPPVMVESCLSGVTGNPAIYPNEELGIAIGSTQGTIGCLDEGHFDLNGGTKVVLTPAMSLAQAVFGVEILSYTDEDDKYEKEEAAIKAMLLELEAKDPDRVMVVDSTYPHFEGQAAFATQWHTNVGSEEEPVILYFDESVDCPKINGGTIVWGLVYFAKRECDNNGWGGGEVHGTVAKRGDMVKFTANAEIHGKSLDFGSGGGEDDGGGTGTVIGEPGGLFSENKFAEIPGSWRDF